MSNAKIAVTSLRLVAVICILASLASASTINVPAQQPTIQQGINAAVNGDTVLVAPGTYTENIDFKGKAITVTSSGGAVATIIDGGQNGSTVTFSTNETHSAVLSGFTIRNASQTGVYVYNASPTVQNNVIVQNGYYYLGCDISLNNSNAIIKGNLISNGLNPGCSGGAIYVYGSSAAQIVGNLIGANPSDGIYAEFLSGSLSILQNTITENQGQGVYSYYAQSGSQMTLIQNSITDNQGIGVYWMNPPVVLISNTIANNALYNCCGDSSEIWGATVNNQVTMENNLVVDSGISFAFGCNAYDTTNLAVIDHNDIFAANSLAYGAACPDLTGNSGNISADPMFAALLSDNVHLTTGSPAINAGNNAAPQLPSKDMDGDPRIVGAKVDMGADEFSAKTTLKLSTYNLRFNPQNVGSTSGAKAMTLTNNGTAAVTIYMIATGPEFSQTNTCGGSIEMHDFA